MCAVWLMCALRAHIKFSIFRNIFSRIEKVVITFSIPKKIFQKWKLMCALRAHISKIHKTNNTSKLPFYHYKNLKITKLKKKEFYSNQYDRYLNWYEIAAFWYQCTKGMVNTGF